MHKAKKFLAACMALVVSLSLFSPAALAEGDTTTEGETSPAVTESSSKVADDATYKNYLEVLDDENNTLNDGRIWADKTVTTGSITFSTDNTTNENKVAPVTVDIGNSDFLVTYSALATSTEVEQSTPVDVVFVLDLSASMNWGEKSEEVTETDATKAKEASRLNAMVNALNQAIDTLVKNNEKNRIGVVVFNGSSKQMMGLTTAKNIAKQVEDENYFEITKFQLKKKAKDTDKQEADATVRCNYNDNTVDTAGGTNIQAGLYRGIKMLKEAGNTTVELDDGSKVTRAPNLILMSDGAPTTFTSALDSSYVDEDGKENIDVSIDSDKSKLEDPPKHEVPSGSWWGELTGKQIGAGNNNEPDSADGFMAMLTAAYGKEQITQHYYQGEEGKSAKIYTIGFSTDKQTDDMAAMANLVLNPEENLITGNVDDVTGVCEEVKKVSSAWQDYQSGKKTVVTAPLGTGTNSTKYQYVVAQVKENGTIYPQSLVYTDKYYSADSKDSLDSAFSDIVQSIVTGAKMPTQVTGSATSSGYLTYKDPLGQYMQVDSVKAILWNGHKFLPSENPTIEKDEATNTTVTTYHFAGTIDNPAYTPANDVSNIRITVTEKEDKTQEVEIKIPAAAIPLRVNTVTTGSNYSLTSNEALPVRIVYGVSLRDEVMADEDHVNLDALSNEYLAKNQKDGKVYFYSNLYSESSIGNATVGDASVTFTPAENNPFYYMQKDTYLFEDEDFQTPVTNTTLDPEKTYYFEASYYDKTGYKTVAVERKGQDFVGVTPKTDDEGKVYLPEGSPRLGNLNQFVKTKANNAALTNTAATYYYPHYMGSFYASGASTLAEGAQGDSFGIALGNNGAMGVAPAEGSLTISKSVTADAGLTAPDATFTFQVKLTKDGKALTGSYTCTKVSAENKETEDTLTLDDSTGSGEITLQAGEHATIEGLPVGTSYEVTEPEDTMPGGFALTSSTGTKDTLAAGNLDATAAFTNKYSVTRATLTLNGTKTLQNAVTQQDEPMTDGQFQFLVFAAENGQKVGKAIATGKSTENGSIVFNEINTFEKEKTYQLWVEETGSEPTGYSYDKGHYLLTVNVTDNHEGALEAEVVGGVYVDADGNETSKTDLAFANTYKPEEAQVKLTAHKNLIKDGQSQALTADAFQFLLKPTGTVAGDPVAKDGLTAYNKDDGSIDFVLNYTQENTYTYTLTEVEGSDENIEYDSTSYQVTVEITDDKDGVLQPSVTVQKNGVTVSKDQITFQNYVKMPAKLVIPGNKTVVWGEQAAAEASEQAMNRAALAEVQATGETATEETAAPAAQVALFAAGDTVENNTDVFTYHVLDSKGTVVATATSTGNGAFDIPVSFTQAGEYNYTIQEDHHGETIDGIQYSGASYNLYVKVEPAGEGKLAVTKWTLNNQENAIADFTNTYTVTNLPKDVTLDLNAQKVFKNGTLTENAFRFVIEEESTGKKYYGTNDENGNITFETIAYTQDTLGLHTYKVYEEPGDPYQGITYSEAVYTFTVDVQDNGDGTLNAVVNTQGQDFVFINTYQQPKPATVTVEGTKTLENKALSMGAFSFTLKSEEENGTSITVQNGVTGSDNTQDPSKFRFQWDITLADMDNQAEKTFTYTVSEENGNDPQITYSKEKYTVQVTVQADAVGNLTVKDQKILKADGSEATEIRFDNRYTPKEEPLVLTGTKTLENRPLQDKEFSFVAVEDSTEDPVTVVGYNDADGKITFAPIFYGLQDVGTHTYTVYEVAGSDSHVDYDKAQYTVTVEVRYDKDTLTVSQPEIQKDGKAVESIDFVNTYTPDPAQITLQATKTLTGRALQAGEFSFYLQDDQGKTLAITTNEANGVVNFPAITYSKDQLEGEASKDFTYTVREEKGEDATVEYDETVYTVVIRVTDNGEGAIVPEVFSVTDEKGNTVEDGKMVFTNTVKPEETPEPSPEVTPSPEPTPEVTPTPAPETTPAPEESSEEKTTTTTSSTPAPTATPAPAATPAPTATPAPATVIPQTGDASHPALWALLLVASAGAAAVLWVYKRKRQ